MLADRDRLTGLIELAERVAEQVGATDLEGIVTDRLQLDALAFRLGHVGEGVRKLSDDLKFRHPEIDWTSIVGFRNIIFHEYLGIEESKIWEAATNSLPVLLTVFRLELTRLDQ